MSNLNSLPFADACRAARINLRLLAKDVIDLNNHPRFFEGDCRGATANEMHANVMLAYRHCEDACMRLGKAIQAFDGGVSCYDDTAKPEKGPLLGPDSADMLFRGQPNPNLAAGTTGPSPAHFIIRDCAFRVPITTDAPGPDPTDPNFSKLTTNDADKQINT